MSNKANFMLVAWCYQILYSSQDKTKPKSSSNTSYNRSNPTLILFNTPTTPLLTFTYTNYLLHMSTSHAAILYPAMIPIMMPTFLPMYPGWYPY